MEAKPVAQHTNGTSAPKRVPRDVSLDEAAQILREADDMVIVSHMRPDGDCVGSTVALLLGLDSLGKRVAAFNSHALNRKTGFLDGAERVSQTMPAWTPRLTVFVDCGAEDRVADDFKAVGKTLNIDHHLTNDRFADANYIDVKAAAVGEQVLHLLEKLGAKITPAIASAIFLSVMGDTGGFRYSNTNAETLELAAKLARAGAKPSVIASAYYESRDPGEVLLTGRAFSRLKLDVGGALAWSELVLADFADAGDEVEPDGLVNEMRQVVGVEVSMLMRQCKDNITRVGFRGKGLVDVSAVAAQFGGGGHFNAAGCQIAGQPFAEAREALLQAARHAVAEAVAASNLASKGGVAVERH